MKQPIDPTGVARRRVERLGARAGETLDAVVVEEPLEIRVDGETIGVTMRTPGDDDRLALGFLFGEGIVRSRADVSSVAHCGRPGEEGYGNAIEVRSGPGASLDADRILEGRRFLPTTSACGVCGRQTIEDLIARCGVLVGGHVLAQRTIHAGLEAMRQQQRRFEATGGLHAAAAFDARGALLHCCEDVGRHNAVDKVVGQLLRDARVGDDARSQPPALLAVSGRAGFEIVQKAAMARIPVVVSVSAPTSLSIDLAVRVGITLAGFARDESMNVYTHPWRIVAEEPGPLLRAIPGEGGRDPERDGSEGAAEPVDAGEESDPVEAIALRRGVPLLVGGAAISGGEEMPAGVEAPLWFGAPGDRQRSRDPQSRFGDVPSDPGPPAGGGALSRLSKLAAASRARLEGKSAPQAPAPSEPPAAAREVPVPFAHVIPDATHGAIVVTAGEQDRAEERRRGLAAELVERTDRMLRSTRADEAQGKSLDPDDLGFFDFDEGLERWREALAPVSEPTPEPSWSTMGGDPGAPRTVVIDDRQPGDPAPVIWPRGKACGDT